MVMTYHLYHMERSMISPCYPICKYIQDRKGSVNFSIGRGCGEAGRGG